MDEYNKDKLNLENVLKDKNEENLFQTIFLNEKKIIKTFITSFILILILINSLIFSFYGLYLKEMTFGTIFLIFLIPNLIYLLISEFFYKKLIKHTKEIKNKVQLINQIQLKNEKDLMSARIIEKLSEHMNHELKPPLLSLKNIISEYNNIFNLLINYAKKDGNRIIDKLVYPKQNRNSCLHCSNFNPKDIQCQYFSWYGKPLKEVIEDYKEISKKSMGQIDSTLKITKNLNSLKNKEYNISIYDIFEQSFQTFSMMRKYKFNFKIDKKFKNCFLNGLSPEILSNIIMNHIKNSLEAEAVNLKIIYKRYLNENEKNFVNLEFIDDGEGIKKEIIDKIYDLDFSTKRKYKNENSGVGLYLSKQLLQYFKGNETIKYTSSDGTVFCIKIPVKYCGFDYEDKNNYKCEDYKLVNGLNDLKENKNE